MREHFIVNIPEPCHENWNNMSVAEQGRFCAACSKKVTDMTTMSDMEIFRLLSKKDEKICGRFSEDQLDRPILAPVQPIKKNAWAIILGSFFTFFTSITKGQTARPPQQLKEIKVKQVSQAAPMSIRLGMVEKRSAFIGKLVDETGKSVQNATIYIVGDTGLLHPIVDGIFVRMARSDEKKVKVRIFSTDHEMKEAELKRDLADTIVLKKIQRPKDTVPITQAIECSISGIMGEVVIASVKPARVKDTLKKVVRVFTDRSVRVSPNPVQRGQTLSIELPKYAKEIQLISTSGVTVHRERTNSINKLSLLSIVIPATIPTGQYYIQIWVNGKVKPIVKAITVLN